MNILKSVRNMFDNKKEVEDIRSGNILDYNILYTNDRMLKYTSEGSIIWMCRFDNDLYFEFFQLAEVLPSRRWVTYPFRKTTIVLVSLGVSDILNIYKYCRFANNPFLYKLAENISENIPSKYFEGTNSILSEYKFSRDDIDDVIVDDDFNNIEVNSNDYIDDLVCSTVKIIAYDDDKIVKDAILHAIPEITPYFSNWDLINLIKIAFEYREENVENVPHIYTYWDMGRSLTPDFYLLFSLSKKINMSLFEITSPPIMDIKKLQDNELIDDEISDEIIPDSSKIPEEHWIGYTDK